MNCQRDKLKKVHCDCPFQVDIDNLQELVDEYNVNESNIREILLTGNMFKDEKKPTLEEVKKEWEELGYVFSRTTNKEYGLDTILLEKEEIKTIQGQSERNIIWIHIYVNSKQFVKSRMRESGDMGIKFFTFEEHQLLTKTFKALGWL